ncbi:hypothetical protein FSP39_021199 [Pinctada imbricata]|uniref:Choline transporter-like protein n=1 Tax=Pinctada imbricata TaxID=66713 RepID=A0AA89BUR8_PINIB|nr:hypothetical protein FSP39_021199 [Pinctada imbricata]
MTTPISKTLGFRGSNKISSAQLDHRPIKLRIESSSFIVSEKLRAQNYIESQQMGNITTGSMFQVDTHSFIDDYEEDQPSLDEGPLVERSCRDVIFLIVFIFYIFGMIYVAYLGISTGNPYRLIYGVDSWGNVCNQKNDPINGVSESGKDMTGKKQTFYFKPDFFAPDIPFSDKEDSRKTCVSRCPNETLATPLQAQAFMDRYDDVSICRYDVDTYDDSNVNCADLTILPQTSIFYRCIPEAILSSAKAMAKSATMSVGGMSLGPDVPKKIIADLTSTWKEILYLCAVATGVSLLVVLFMSILAAVIVWVLVLLTIVLCIGATGYCWYNWYTENKDLLSTDVSQRTEEAQESVQTWLIFSSIATGITVIILLILLIMRKRISLVVQLFKEAGKAIKCIPLMLLQPFWTILVLAAALVGLAAIATFIETSGLPTVNNDTGTVSFEQEDMWTYVRWYHLFGILWISAFIVACQDIVLAGAVATWYFTRQVFFKLGCPILKSTSRLIRYHLGSVAFGSFIIALVRLARIILAYVQRKLKGKVGKVAEYLLKVLQCCLWCFEKFLAYLNRNAYIEIAIYGYNFCRAAQKAFLLIISNALRVAAINSIGDFVLFLAKLSSVAIVMAIGTVFFKGKEINYIWAPISVACAVGFVVSHCFLLVYEITIDTIFLCFCEDCERNDGQQKPYYMSKDLMKYLSDSNKAMAALERREQAANKAEDKAKQKQESSKKQDSSQKTTDLTNV